MNDEEKEAIEYVKYQIETGNLIRGYTDIYYFQEEVETVLNLIEKQKAEIETLKRDFEIVDHECSRLEQEDIRKDMMINLMANHIATSDSNLCQYLDMTTKCKYYAGENKKTCDNCIKEYFGNKVKESK